MLGHVTLVGLLAGDKEEETLTPSEGGWVQRRLYIGELYVAKRCVYSENHTAENVLPHRNVQRLDERFTLFLSRGIS